MSKAKQETIFGIPISEIKRQCAADTLKCDSNSPLVAGRVSLDPIVETGKKVLADPELTEFFRSLYTGR